MSVSIVVPIWNESQNIPELVHNFANSYFTQIKNFELVLVDNGSSDNSWNLLKKYSITRPWMTILHLDTNMNYGGAISFGIENSKNFHVGIVSGDLQVLISDIEKVWAVYSQVITKSQDFIVKGRRTNRHDSHQARFVSLIYTILVNVLLKTRIFDVNGLPKFFSKNLWRSITHEKLKDFSLDAQILMTARFLKLKSIEVPISYFDRKNGVSTWSKKRLKVYRQSIKNLILLKHNLKIMKAGQHDRNHSS